MFNTVTHTIEEVMAADGRRLFDVRSREEYEAETAPGALHADWEMLLAWAQEQTVPAEKADAAKLEAFCAALESGKPIDLLCYTGDHSEEIAFLLQEQGYPVYSIEHGWQAFLRWRIAQVLADADEEAAAKRILEVERSINKKFKKEIWKKFTKAIREYDLIQDGDKIAVCISGGKDSMLMGKLFQELQRHGKKNFECIFLVMNPGYNEENYQRILDNAALIGLPITVFESRIYDIVANDMKNPCYMCARMRRGTLYAKAQELGCNKIALGHHFDDVIETILMGMLHGGQIQTMMPKLHSDHFPGMQLIRPLYLIREQDIVRWARYNDLRFILCACRLTDSCSVVGGTETGSKRAEVKALIKQLAKDNPFLEKNIFRSVENVNLKTVIAYKENGNVHHFLDWYESGIPPIGKVEGQDRDTCSDHTETNEAEDTE